MNHDIYSKAEKVKDYAVKIRRLIHQHPELSMKEFNTTALVTKELQEMGIQVVPLGLKAGVLGILKGTKEGSGPVIALRADMDALPITEKTGLPYASQSEGVMHACGHDGHMAILLGTAKLLSSMRNAFSGVVKFIFQPGEEVFQGAKEMVDAGVLEDPPVDMIVALHCYAEAEVGQVLVWDGAYMASADRFSIKITGQGGHGASPHMAKDSLLASAHLVTALQGIVSREIDCLENVVLSVCTINAGTAFNIIPESVLISGTVRCQGENIRKTMAHRIERITAGTCQAFGCRFDLDYVNATPPVINHPEVNEMILRAGTEVLGQDKVGRLGGPEMGSEDFAYFLEKVPYGAFFRLGIANPGEKRATIHNQGFDFNDEALPAGIAVLSRAVINKSQ